MITNNMLVHEFFAKYANTPLGERLVLLDVGKHGLLTLNEIYKELSRLEDAMRPMRIEEERLLRIVDKHYAREQK